MKGGRYAMQMTPRLLTSLLGVATCFVLAAPAAAADDPPAVAGQAPAGAGMTIYIDPQTGAIRSDPAPGTEPLQLSPEERNALSTSQEGLVEVPSPVPGGGSKVDLQGRFQSPLIGTIDANGKFKMQHLGDTPGSGDKK